MKRFRRVLCLGLTMQRYVAIVGIVFVASCIAVVADPPSGRRPPGGAGSNRTTPTSLSDPNAIPAGYLFRVEVGTEPREDPIGVNSPGTRSPLDGWV